MTRVSAAVMHVPGSGRAPYVAAILAALPPEWAVTVVEDPNREGCWATAKRAWQARPAESTHHVVFSDDAVLCDHFGELLMGALQVRPEAVLSLCTRYREPVDEAVIKRRSWLHSQDYVYGQGIVMPTKWIDEMLTWVEQYVRLNYVHDDGRVGMWARATGRGIYTPVPQLVRHQEGPSLMGHGHAHGLGTPLFAADRRDVNWDTPALEVGGSLFSGRGLRLGAPPALVAKLAPPQHPRTPAPKPARTAPRAMSDVLSAHLGRLRSK